MSSHPPTTKQKTSAYLFQVELTYRALQAVCPFRPIYRAYVMSSGKSASPFPIGDSNALMQHLSYLRDHPDVVERYARQAQAKARRYNWERSVDAHERLFRKIIVEEEIKEAVETGKPIDVAILETLSAHLDASSNALYEAKQEARQLERCVIYGEHLEKMSAELNTKEEAQPAYQPPILANPPQNGIMNRIKSARLRVVFFIFSDQPPDKRLTIAFSIN